MHRLSIEVKSGVTPRNKRNIQKIVTGALGCILISFGLAAESEPQTDSSAEKTAHEGTAARAVQPISGTFLVNSDLVLIPVSVTDGKGRAVNGLDKDQFTLYEDKVEQVITHFAAEDAPVSIGIVFDASDSMEPRMHKAREAVNALVRNANPDDEFFLVQFSDGAELAAGLTKNAAEIQARAASIQTGGSTALLDAVLLAIREMKKAANTRKAIVIISDGEDNSSHCSVNFLKESVRESDSVIYAIGIDNSDVFTQNWGRERLSGAALLNEIATQTGGKLFEVSRLKQLPEVASNIGAQLRSQYLLGYTPSNNKKHGGYHRIQVKLARPKGFPRLHAAWRLGYYAPER
jgi:VWFA-related protein